MYNTDIELTTEAVIIYVTEEVCFLTQSISPDELIFYENWPMKVIVIKWSLISDRKKK